MPSGQQGQPAEVLPSIREPACRALQLTRDVCPFAALNRCLEREIDSSATSSTPTRLRLMSCGCLGINQYFPAVADIPHPIDPAPELLGLGVFSIIS